jgi:hypothetical protein
MDEDTSTLSATDVTEVVRYVVRQLAPEELEVVDAVADAWLADELGNRRSRGTPGTVVGFGVEHVLLSQLLFPIVSAAIGDVLGTIALKASRLSRKRRKTSAEPVGSDSAKAGSMAKGGLPVRLTREQAEDLHAAFQRNAQALGLSSAKAALLADATLGALIVADGRDPRRSDRAMADATLGALTGR